MIWLFNAPFALPATFWTASNNNFLSFKQIETAAYSSEGCVLDNISDTLSVTGVDTSLSKFRIRMSSSYISPVSFGPPVILASLRLQSTRAFAEPLRFHFFFTPFTSRLFPWMELIFFITSFHTLIFLFISAL